MIETIEHPNGIAEIRLARPPVNALNPALVTALSEAISRSQQEGATAIILSGSPGLFSAGLDVPELLALDEAGMRQFWRAFFGLLEQLARSPVLTVAALTGHSPAGGTVLALFCDYRIQADGEFRLGLNEVQVGLVVPPVIHRALARLIGTYPAERHLVAGQMIPADQAHAIGLVDERVPAAEVIDRALAWLNGHLAMPAHALSATRALCRADLIAHFEDREALDLDAFVAGWFAADTQKTLNELVARLKARG